MATYPFSLPYWHLLQDRDEDLGGCKNLMSLDLNTKIRILCEASPETIDEYVGHNSHLVDLLSGESLSVSATVDVTNKFKELAAAYPKFISKNPLKRQGWRIVDANFDKLVRFISETTDLSTAVIAMRLLTQVVMLLNYWEVYNLLTWKPALYEFMKMIDFDFTECYNEFMVSYHNEKWGPPVDLRTLGAGGGRDKFRRRRTKINDDIPAKVIKKMSTGTVSTKLLNYDPDVIHECQLPLADYPEKLCLRRFSRKYELIRHQETVHSKKKKLFKCFVCVRQNPAVGPRIFTRHDTLAKHIRVNHKISGKEAKAEVAYSKKHAEVVDDNDLLLHAGRRKTKADFEIPAQLGKKDSADQGEYSGELLYGEEP